MSLAEKAVIQGMDGYYVTIRPGERGDPSKDLGGGGCDNLVKVYGERGTHLSLEDAFRLVGLMRRFDDTAGSLGVDTVKPLGFWVTNDTHPGRVNLRELVPLITMRGESMGRVERSDLQYLFEQGRLNERERLSMVQQMLGMHQKVAAAGYPITLDAAWANFCFDGRRVYYVDKMPPRQRLDDGSYFVEIPDPPEKARSIVEARHFSSLHTRLVYMQGMKAMAMTGNGWMVPHFREQIGEIMGPEHYALIDVNLEGQRRVAVDPQIADVDLMRMLGWEYFHEGRIDIGDAKRVHSLTHIHNGGILPKPEEINEAAALLKGAI